MIGIFNFTQLVEDEGTLEYPIKFKKHLNYDHNYNYQTTSDINTLAMRMTNKSGFNSYVEMINRWINNGFIDTIDLKLLVDHHTSLLSKLFIVINQLYPLIGISHGIVSTFVLYIPDIVVCSHYVSIEPALQKIKGKFKWNQKRSKKYISLNETLNWARGIGGKPKIIDGVTIGKQKSVYTFRNSGIFSISSDVPRMTSDEYKYDGYYNTLLTRHSIQFTKRIGGNTLFNWRKWQIELDQICKIRLTFWFKFVNAIPLARNGERSNSGIKIYNIDINAPMSMKPDQITMTRLTFSKWMDQCQIGKWKQIEIEFQTKHIGILRTLLIFDTFAAGQVVRFVDFNLELKKIAKQRHHMDSSWCRAIQLN